MKSGFTLIELLVVITIIVVLLSLLTPALDRAIYQAELMVCGTQLKGLGGGAFSYASEHRRSYFYRPAVRQAGVGNYRPRDLNVPFNTSQTSNINGYDDRPVMRGYFDINILQDPLSGELELDEADPETYVAGSYSNFIGWKYDVSGQNDDEPKPSRGLFRLGDRLGYDGQNYSTLAGDLVHGDFGVQSTSHPDSDGVMALESQQGDTNAQGSATGQNSDAYTYSQWRGVLGRSKLDLNFLKNDGSVIRMNQQIRGKPLVWVPPYKDVRWNIVGTLALPPN